MTKNGPYSSTGKPLNDLQLVALLQGGNEDAFAEIYSRYYPNIYKFVLRYLKSPALSEDICQNVFAKIWEQKAQLNEVRTFSAYLFTIAKRQSLDYLKRAANEQVAMGLIVQNYNQVSNDVEEAQRSKEYMAFIEEVLSRLPVPTQMAFRLCREEKKSYDEAAAILGISRNTVKKYMVHSMKVLKSSTEEEFGLTLSLILAVLFSQN